MSARHFEIIKRPGLIVPEAALRRRSICYSGSPPLILTYLGTNHNVSGTSVSLNFGTTNPKRYLIAAVGIGSSSSISAVTIGGVTATRLVSVISPFGSVRTYIYIAAVPTGTSGSVAASGSSGTNIAVALYSAVNLQSASAFATDTDSGESPLSMSLGVQEKGFIIAAAYQEGDPGTSASWTGLTTFDVNSYWANLSVGRQFSAGNYIAPNATTRALSVSIAGGTNAFSCAAAALR